MQEKKTIWGALLAGAPELTSIVLWLEVLNEKLPTDAESMMDAGLLAFELKGAPRTEVWSSTLEAPAESMKILGNLFLMWICAWNFGILEIFQGNFQNFYKF